MLRLKTNTSPRRWLVTVVATVTAAGAMTAALTMGRVSADIRRLAELETLADARHQPQRDEFAAALVHLRRAIALDPQDADAA